MLRSNKIQISAKGKSKHLSHYNKRVLYKEGKVFKWTKQDALTFLPWCGYPVPNYSVPKKGVYTKNMSSPINSSRLKSATNDYYKKVPNGDPVNNACK